MDLKKLTRSINFSFSVIQFSAFASSFVIFLYATVILLSKGFTNTEVGVTVAAGSGASILMPPLFASIYARHPGMPLKRLTAYVRIGTLVFSVLLIFVNTPILIVAIIFIIISCTTISAGPLTNALIMQYENVNVPVNYGLARSMGSLATAGMGYVSGLLSEGWGGINAVIVLSILLLSVTTIATLTLPLKVLKGHESAPARMPAGDSLGLSILKKPVNIMFFIVTVFIWANMAVLDTYQVSILKSVGGNDMDYGILLTVMTLCEVPLMWFFKPLAKRFSYVQLMTAGFFFLMAKDVALVFTSSVTAVVAVQCFNLATIGLFSPASVYYSNAIVDPKQAVQSQALFSGTAIAVGRILGGLTGGVIIDNFGLKVLMALSAGYALLCIVVMQISNRVYKKSGSSQIAMER